MSFTHTATTRTATTTTEYDTYKISIFWVISLNLPQFVFLLPLVHTTEDRIAEDCISAAMKQKYGLFCAISFHQVSSEFAMLLFFGLENGYQVGKLESYRILPLEPPNRRSRR